jgi:sugar transferase (PEP-CTERM system associated)
LSIRIFNLHVRLPLVLMALIEGSIFLVAPQVTVFLLGGWLGFDLGKTADELLAASFLFAALGLLALLSVGLYSTRQRCNAAGVAVRVTTAVTGAVALSALAYYFLPEIGIGRRILIPSAGLVIVACFVVRTIFDRLYKGAVFKRQVLVLGAGRRASSLAAQRRRSDTQGYQLVGFIAVDGDDLSVPTDQVVRRPPDLFHWSLDNQVDEIVVAMDDRRRGFPMEDLLECRLAGIDVLELASFLERETGKVRLDVVNPSWIVLGEGFKDSTLQQALVRAFDIVASGLLLVLAVPLMLLAAAAIRLEDGWRAPVLYRQQRVGRYNELFELLKIRSMRENAEQTGAVWAVPEDPRITRVGSFIRKTRIDELPQLVNVLRGDMSFVGPRPERPEFVEQLAKVIPYYRARHAVKPGITGWAQLCYPYGASEKDALEKLQFDLFYVKNRSLLFDFAILVQTVEVVVWRKGAV